MLSREQRFDELLSDRFRSVVLRFCLLQFVFLFIELSERLFDELLPRLVDVEDAVLDQLLFQAFAQLDLPLFVLRDKLLRLQVLLGSDC